MGAVRELQTFEQAERQTVEQLGYFGMRIAFGGEASRRALRLRARACAKRKYHHLSEWLAGGPYPAMRWEGKQHLDTALEKGRSAIVCSPHVGPYYRIPLELSDHDLPVTLLLDQENFDHSVTQWPDWAKRYTGHLPDPLSYVNAEKPTAVWQLARALQSGRLLLIYMEGNTGLEVSDAQKTLVDVTFCGIRIRVRKGLAYLSARTGAPIVPAVARCTRNGGHALRFEQPIEIRPNEPVDDYCQRALQHCFSILERYARRDSAGWEMWYHLHRWRKPEILPVAAQVQPPAPEEVLQCVLMADTANMDLLDLPEGRVLAHLGSGEALALTAPILSLLRAFDGRKRLQQVLDRLASKYDETVLLEALHALSDGRFVFEVRR
ncbi:MAG: hypothetical protein P8Z30_20405 [Acidobacteriota bacterium]